MKRRIAATTATEIVVIKAMAKSAVTSRSITAELCFEIRDGCASMREAKLEQLRVISVDHCATADRPAKNYGFAICNIALLCVGKDLDAFGVGLLGLLLVAHIVSSVGGSRRCDRWIFISIDGFVK